MTIHEIEMKYLHSLSLDLFSSFVFYYFFDRVTPSLTISDYRYMSDYKRVRGNVNQIWTTDYFSLVKTGYQCTVSRKVGVREKRESKQSTQYPPVETLVFHLCRT